MLQASNIDELRAALAPWPGTGGFCAQFNDGTPDVTCSVEGAKSFTSIGSEFLYKCTSLKSINCSGFQKVTHIGSEFLGDCRSLTSADLSGFTEVTQIGNWSLFNASFTSIDLSAFKELTHIGDAFLYNCTSLKSINCSGFQKVTFIGDEFLGYCPSLTSIDLSAFKAVTHIEKGFLDNCKSLTSIDFSGFTEVTHIGSEFLDNCGVKHVVTGRGRVAASTVFKANCESRGKSLIALPPPRHLAVMCVWALLDQAAAADGAMPPDIGWTMCGMVGSPPELGPQRSVPSEVDVVIEHLVQP